MNYLQDYSSSSEDEEMEGGVDVPNLPKATPTNINTTESASNSRRALGGGFKNTYNESMIIPESNIQIRSTQKLTDLVPSVLRKKNTYKEKKVGAAIPSLDLNIGQIFETDPSLNTPQKISTNQATSVPTLPSIDYGVKIEDTVSAEEPLKPVKRSKRTIDEAQIIDFNLNDFYDQNNKLISSGELNFEAHERSNKKVKYYNTTGTNQLSNLMKFSAENTAKLDSMHQKSMALKSETAKKYGFRK